MSKVENVNMRGDSEIGTPMATQTEASYWESERIIAWSFNKLKAKLFNLVEASIADKVQQNAVIGLIKGFANDEYRTCIREMRYWGRSIKVLAEGEDSSLDLETNEPLENRNGIFG